MSMIQVSGMVTCGVPAQPNYYWAAGGGADRQTMAEMSSCDSSKDFARPVVDVDRDPVFAPHLRYSFVVIVAIASERNDVRLLGGGLRSGTSRSRQILAARIVDLIVAWHRGCSAR
jgi:hypothetical protein